MRFSLKWALAATAYVALISAAIGAKNALLADFVCGVTAIAFCYALIVAYCGLGKRRYMATGFVVVSAANVICLHLAPDRAPSSRFLAAAGIHVSAAGDPFLSRTTQGKLPQQNVTSLVGTPELRPVLSTTHAVAAMVAGLVGCGLGALAYRRGNRTVNESAK